MKTKKPLYVVLLVVAMILSACGGPGLSENSGLNQEKTSTTTSTLILQEKPSTPSPQKRCRWAVSVTCSSTCTFWWGSFCLLRERKCVRKLYCRREKQ